jgi:hypothetical protein
MPGESKTGGSAETLPLNSIVFVGGHELEWGPARVYGSSGDFSGLEFQGGERKRVRKGLLRKALWALAGQTR